VIRGTEIKIEQNTDAWLLWRNAGIIGGSDAPSVKLGENHPYRTPLDLFKQKTGQMDGPVMNAAMQRGHDLEPIARDLFVSQTGIHMRPACYEHPKYQFLRASVDGIAEDGQSILEIKCPNDRAHKEALNGQVPYYYMAQLQHNLMITGASVCFYWSYSDRAAFKEGERTALVMVGRDEAYIDDLLKRELAFANCVKQGIPPTGDYTAPVVQSVTGLVQLSGYARVGKDTFGKIIVDTFGATRFAYADKVKDVAVALGLWDGKERSKEKARKHLIAIGEHMRHVYPDVWVKGVFRPESGVYEAMQGSGVVITDCRKVNEVLNGDRAAESLEVPHRLFWIERPNVGPVHESERDETRHLRNLADRVILNDYEMQDSTDTEPLRQALLSAMSPVSHRELSVSDFVELERRVA
jgi:putative phage-type endonuclease